MLVASTALVIFVDLLLQNPSGLLCKGLLIGVEEVKDHHLPLVVAELDRFRSLPFDDLKVLGCLPHSLSQCIGGQQH